MKEENLIIEATGRFIYEGDALEAYKKLQQAKENGNSDVLACDIINVWAPFENEHVDSLLDMINDHISELKSILEKNIPEFIKNIDWQLLKDQKNDLLTTIIDLAYDAKEANKAGEEKLASRLTKQSQSIQGIINLIDSIQDYVVDELNIPEKEVFEF